MLVIMSPDSGEPEYARVEEAIRGMGYTPLRVPGADRTAICVTGNRGPVEDSYLVRLPGVARCIPVTKPFKLVSREVHPEDTVVEIGAVTVGGPHPVVAAGPGSVETEARTLAIARAVRDAGAHLFRARLWSEQIGPYRFAGLGDEGLHTLERVREETGLPVVTEIVDPRSAERVADHVDAVEVAARHMENEPLLEVAASLSKPVIVDRGPSATVEEWLLAAESLLAREKRDVVLCERGVRTAGQARTLLDLHVVPVVRRMSHLPVFVNLSRAVAERDRVRPLARAAAGAGASGLLIEVHTHPDTAYTDPRQTVDVATFSGILGDLAVLRELDPL